MCVVFVIVMGHIWLIAVAISPLQVVINVKVSLIVQIRFTLLADVIFFQNVVTAYGGLVFR